MIIFVIGYLERSGGKSYPDIFKDGRNIICYFGIILTFIIWGEMSGNFLAYFIPKYWVGFFYFVFYGQAVSQEERVDPIDGTQ